MSAGTLWQVVVRVTPAAEEAAAALFAEVFGRPPVVCTDAETGVTEAGVYLERRAGLTREKRRQLVTGLRRLREAGGPPGTGCLLVRKLRREDWAESWKRHFKPLEFGRALLVKPSWSRRRPRAGQSVVVLDPGLSFGTGQHPTTRFCLEQLVAFRRVGERQAFLDVGTGSGLLAIAAAKLGYAPVEAFDCDPAAVRVARENARRNGVLSRLRLRGADLTRLPAAGGRRFDLICANLQFDLLLLERHRLMARLRPGGRLVLAGVLRAEFPALRRAFTASGLRVLASRTEQGWTSGVFVNRVP